MKKLLYILFLCLSATVYAQSLKLTYSEKIDSLPNQTVNIPVICENLTNEVITVFPEYFSMTYDDFRGYKLNRMSPKPINPGRKELIFISLHPSINMTGGKRYFPFSLKDETGQVRATGFFEMTHIVHEHMDIIPLSDYRYIIPDIDDSVSFLLHNKGSVPVEFKTTDYKISRIIQPGGLDTLVVKLSEIEILEKNDFWVNFKIEYYVTTIYPNELKVDRHTLHRFIPIAHKSSYPKKIDYYDIPVNFSQYFFYDESQYGGRKLISRQLRTSLYGSGYIDDYPSPYLYWRADYIRDDMRAKPVFWENFRGNLQFRSETFSLELGESSYLMDLKDTRKYGNGISASFQMYHLYLEETYMKERYGDQSRMNAFSFGYVWEVDPYLFEQQQFVRYRLFMKNPTLYRDMWFGPYKWENMKHIVETQFKVGHPLTFHFEVFTSETYGQKPREPHLKIDPIFETVPEPQYVDKQPFAATPGFTAEMLLNTHYFYDRLSLIYDEISVRNETDHRKKLQNDMNINTGYFDLYTSAKYQDEMTQYSSGSDYDSESIYGYANLYIRTYEDYYLRGKGFDNQVYVYKPISENLNRSHSSEVMGGLMLKKDYFEIEGLFGMQLEKHTLYDFFKKTPIIDVNLTARRPRDNAYHLSLNNRIDLPAIETDDVKEVTVQSYLSFYNAWSERISQNTGTYYYYNGENSWRDYFSVFSYLNVHFPWEHDLRVGGSYSINTSVSENYRYSVSAEYSLPIAFNVIPKSNKKYLTVSVFDPWQKKPVSNAVFDIDSHYYVTNEQGLIRPKKTQIANNPVRIINLPAGFTTEPDLSQLNTVKEHKIDLRIIPYSQLTVHVKKQAYERISPLEAEKTPNKAYYRSSLVNLDKTVLEECSEPIELILRRADNPYETHRQTLNQQGYVVFDGLSAGEYILSLNESSVSDLSIDTGEQKIVIEANVSSEKGILLREKVVPFVRYE